MSRSNSQEIGVGESDALLESLVFLTGHFGQAKSAQALTAGLAYDDKNMGPTLFCEAAERAGLKAQSVRRKSIGEIPDAVLPVVLILGGNQAVVLLEAGSKTAKIFSPETKSVRDVPLKNLEKDYAGYTIFIHPKSEFSNQEAAHGDEISGHWFWGLVRDNRSIYGTALIGGIFINLFALASPIFIMNVYDRVIPNNAIETGWALGIGALTVFIFDFIMRTLRAYLIDLAGRRIDVVAARRIYDQVLNMKLAGRPRSSGVFANMLREFDSVRDFFTSATVTVLVDLPFSIFFLFVVFHLGGGLAFIPVGLMVIVVMAGFFIQAKLKAHVRSSVRTAESKHGLLVETIHGLETVKAISADGRFRSRYTEYAGRNAKEGQDSRFWSGLGVNIATLLQQAASVLIVLAGMYVVQAGDMTVGSLIATVILAGRAIAPIGQIANLMTRYHQAGSALKTLDGIMRQPVERPAGKRFLHRPDLKGKIRLDKVSFAYPQVDRKVLDGVSFSIEAGEKVGIIGRVGSGKSTLARLMLNLYEPVAGAIYADETDYRQIDPADLRRRIAYIAQDVVLFSGSVRDNITASVPHAGEDEILAASKTAGVHDFVARHPMGYDAPVGEHGLGLSGGQRQAVALARAMLLNPNILVCDEPTNAMDVQAEEGFRRYIENNIAGRTLILITHKQAMLPMVDRLILLDQGKVIMDGPRDRVLEALASGKIEVRA
ncbi:MAG: type I secretion system permease/ATPase [Alphaproteobacteria bacterium]